MQPSTEVESEPELFGHSRDSLVEQRHHAAGDITWDPSVVGFRHSASDACQRVGVASERNGVANRIFITRRLQECDQRLRYRAIARFVKAVVRADLVESSVEVVAELRRNEIPKLILVLIFPRVGLRGDCG